MSYSKSLILCASAAALMMAACGDETTYVTQGNDTSFVPILDSGKKLDKQPCDTTNIGSQLYVKDSSAMYFCDGEDWVSMKGEKGDKGDTGKKGADGKNGADGKDGDNGASCTAKKIEKDKRSGYILTCGKDVVDTLWDGKNGRDGENGQDGKKGTDGSDGKSAYELAVKNGFEGSEEEWLESLKAEAIYGQFVDERDGQWYRTVRIGDQVWMAQNLNYGDSVKTPNLKGATWCGGSSDTTEGDCSVYGRLYTWTAAINKPEDECGDGHECGLSGTVQGICPDGWHLPDITEFKTLWNAVGGADVAGIMLKSISVWSDCNVVSGGILKEENANGLDAYGFSALPAGNRLRGGEFENDGYLAYFWFSSEHSSRLSYHMGLYCYSARAILDFDYKNNGFSVRCLKNN